MSFKTAREQAVTQVNLHMDALDAARKADGLRHDAAQSNTHWRMICADLRRHDWVVYAKQKCLKWLLKQKNRQTTALK